MALKRNPVEASSDQINFVGAGTYLEGMIETRGSLRIDGKVKGTVKCSDRVTIGSTGEVNGEIHAKNAVIGGKVEGDVNVEQKLILEKSSSLNGNLSTGKLVIDDGAHFNGKSAMGGDRGKPVVNAASNNNGKKSIFDKPAVAKD